MIFEEIVDQFEVSVKSVLIKIGSKFDFDNQDYASEKVLAKVVFDNLQPISDLFLSVALGVDRDSNIEPDFRTVMNFPKRFLKIPSIEFVPEPSRKIIENILRNTFLLGLTSHLIFQKFPSRPQVYLIDQSILLRSWWLESLVSDTLMKDYNKKLANIPSFVFEAHYALRIEPYLKKPLKIGFMLRSRCYSYLNNLFFAGARLGMCFDLMTLKPASSSDT